jgi:hypothetical protein
LTDRVCSAQRAEHTRPLLNRDEPRRRLDPALLADAELAVGPTAWRRFHDPLPAWDDLDAHEHFVPLPRRLLKH